ncbi:patatin-like phospholipase family protein [Roseomonas fluvialis]|uniref:patatin-like phospholipase family protein n=1 Tax=Roseomonas fluvialis TaxID=1750527 RepID=UPI001FCB19D4|nr:patatin-like phospholipase family protein [Roseomonas fluvialis]
MPQTLQDHTQILGIPNARFFPDTQAVALFEEFAAASRREALHLGLPPDTDPRRLPPANLLALSGGSDHGAFGAGILVGWTELGTRPEFKLVTGISTGALTAPLAFVGSSKDPVLRDVYTAVGPDQIFRMRDWISILFADALTDTRPLREMLARHMNEATVGQIAEGYRQGRLLLIGTTNLDAMRGVIWNVGAIAASGRPGAADLIRDLMLASASVPTFFPPVMIQVEAEGRTWQEMHVDGGAMAQTFLYPPALTQGRNLRAGALARARRAWVIRNARLGGEWQQTERGLLPISGRAISSMIAASGQNDILRLQTNAVRDGIDFNLTYIGEDFTLPWVRPFDREWMRALFEYGRLRTVEGRTWQSSHPALAVRPAGSSTGATADRRPR